MKRFFTLFAVILTATLAFGQQSQPIPIDPAVRIGHLDNGLTYYIRHHEEPKGQANFYIAQKVGSILEEENQRGLAHFLEHMCFNGTQHFPGNGVIKYCESIGVKFGQNLNAYTSIDETVYNIDNVPVATAPTAIDSCLWILHDWADGLLLEDDDIDHERGVIHEEWRTRMNSAMLRMYEKILPEVYPGNKYGERMPIGLMSVVDNFPYKALRDYYEKWYRPDQQGIVVVGDIDVDAVEAKIKEIFGTIAKPENPAERYYVQIEDNAEPIVSIATDKEQPVATALIFCKHDAYPNELKGDFNYLVYSYAQYAALIMMNSRISELLQSPEPPFIQASIGDDDFFLSKTKKAWTGSVAFPDGGFEKGLTTLYREMLRAVRGGFTASEYERAKAEILSYYESQYNSREKRKSAEFCSEYVRHFIDNEPIAGIENMYAIAQQMIPMIPVEVINQIVATFVGEGNLVVACMLPEREGVVWPDAQQVKDMLASVAAENIEPYVDAVSNEPLISEMPKAGKVKKDGKAAFGYEKYTLSNGATVYFRHTDFNKDEILMSAFSYGGSSQYPEQEAPVLKALSGLMAIGGVGNFNSTELTKALSGKNVGVSPFVTFYKEGISANSTPKDLETMFQLTYLYFTALREDQDAFTSWKTRQGAAIANRQSQPMAAFQDTLSNTIYDRPARVKAMDLQDMEQIDYNRALAIARERFANAADFTFV
ncbi:MAG: insulinase family protein, partial [Bacteroidales bacterium]|nr:insulinase family protein [Bacteroidales bacterium]